MGVYGVGGMKYYRISPSCTCIVIVPPRNEKRSASWYIFYDEAWGKALRTGDVRQDGLELQINEISTFNICLTFVIEQRVRSKHY